MNNTDFPILDADRTTADNDYGRCVMDAFGYVEPYISETDSWVAIPLRLVHDQGEGWHLELGPYNLSGTDVARLREAIAAYDLAVAPHDLDATEQTEEDER